MEITLHTANSFKQLGKRSNQEDARFPDKDSANSNVFVICDGVGGNEAGEVASNIVCESIGRNVEDALAQNVFNNKSLSYVLKKAYDNLDEYTNTECQNMATTMAMVVFHRDGVTMSHIGDSRIYHFRKGEGILYRSKDHSLVQELVSVGQLTDEQARMHPQSNIITRSMSANGRDYCPATTLNSADIKEGDIFLLCTDGVLSEITDNVLTELILNESPDSEKLYNLSQICKNSNDNNTAIMVSIGRVVYEENDNTNLIQQKSPTDILPAETEGLLGSLLGLFYKFIG